jgi:hypothetical protein
MPSIVVFHGTDINNYYNIKNSNFLETIEDDWLGDGTYFFTEGISDPRENAKKWAIDRSFDPSAPYKRLYNKYVVLEVEIIYNDKDFWDLTSLDGLKTFNYARERIVEKLKGQNNIYDSDIVKNVVEKMKFSFIKAHFYIKFGKQRKLKFKSKIPNVTVVIVKNPSQNINRGMIKNSIQGDIL